MGRANNKCSSCSFKVQQIFRSVIGIHHKACNILILICKLFFSQIFMLNMGEPILGYLNSHLQEGKNNFEAAPQAAGVNTVKAFP